MHVVCYMSGECLAAPQQASLSMTALASVIMAGVRPYTKERALQGLYFMEFGRWCAGADSTEPTAALCQLRTAAHSLCLRGRGS